jgi:pimeloyl-ACP methyl ester carboxylesterase
MGQDARTRRVRANGLNFSLTERGEGECVFLLHGFPSTSSLWRNQLGALAEAGFHAVAPDLRGRGGTDKPQLVDDYAMTKLVGDVIALQDALGVRRAHLVGHDWGAVLAWEVAIANPDRVERLVVLTIPHPSVGRSIRQLEMYWYIFLFQFVGLAEVALAKDGWRLFREWCRDAPDIDAYVEDLSHPGALTAALNWYRANASPEAMVAIPTPGPHVVTPTLGVSGAHDPYMIPERIQESGEYVTGPWRYEHFADAGHWLPLEKPERLNRLLVDFMSGNA